VNEVDPPVEIRLHATQATEAEGIRVMPRFAEEQHVDGEVATNVLQIIELVGHGPRLRNELYCVEWDVKL